MEVIYVSQPGLGLLVCGGTYSSEIRTLVQGSCLLSVCTMINIVEDIKGSQTSLSNLLLLLLSSVFKLLSLG
jgi:hypothetical protein